MTIKNVQFVVFYLLFLFYWQFNNEDQDEAGRGKMKLI